MDVSENKRRRMRKEREWKQMKTDATEDVCWGFGK